MRRRNWAGMLAVATTCALVGAASGIATSGAATTAKTTAAAKAKAAAAAKAKAAAVAAGAAWPDHGGRHGGFAVHSVSVQLNEAGTAFVTVTRDEGTVKAISGNEITVHEGTATVTYQDAAITVPDGATITRNDATAALADIKVGDRISISTSSDGTYVRADDPTFRPAGGRGHGRFGGPPPPADPNP